jgi:peptide/nickel transport system permease protein
VSRDKGEQLDDVSGTKFEVDGKRDAVASVDIAPAVPQRVRPVSRFGQAARRLQRSSTALLGLGIITLLVAVASFADVLAPYHPIRHSPTELFQTPSRTHWLGTDQFGRDMLSRLMHGSRVSLVVGLSSVLLALFVGAPLGAVAGFYGGNTDAIIMRLMDLILCFPVFLLAIVIMVMFTPTAGLIGAMKVIMAIAIIRIPLYARLVRGSVLSIKEKEYIEACRALGQRDAKILLWHMLPNCFAPLMVTATLSIATAIIVEASLSFLGLGTQPPTPSWGWDLKANVPWMQENAWLAVGPGCAIFITVLGFNLLGDGLRDALDPRLK